MRYLSSGPRANLTLAADDYCSPATREKGPLSLCRYPSIYVADCVNFFLSLSLSGLR